MKHYHGAKIIFPFFVTLIFVMFFCHTTDNENKAFSYDYQVPEQVNDGWETTHINNVDIDPAPLMDMMNNYFGEYSHSIHSILIVKDKKLVFEEYWAGYDFGPPENNWRGEYLDFDRDTLHCLHSATKSFTSAMLGITIDLGYLSDESKKMYLYFPDYIHLIDQEKKKIAIQHLLTMTSGLQWNSGDLLLTDENNDLHRLVLSTDPIGYILQKNVIHEPGTFFYYSGGDTNLAGEIVNRVSGMNIDYLSREKLFAPLGVTNFYWKYFYYAKNIVYCSGDLYLRPRDMAKFGLLFLDKGVWKGRRIISEKWVNKSTSQQVSFDGNGDQDYNGYGYQWWLRDYDVNGQQVHSFQAGGWGGQRIFVFPDLNSVVVFTGGTYNVYPPPEHDIVQRYILPALL